MDNIKSSFLSNITKKYVDSKDRWPELLDEIDKGNVIPVIGPDLLVEPHVNDDGVTENLHQQIISVIASLTNVTTKPRTFSQLVYNDNYRYTFAKNDPTLIFPFINELINNTDNNININFEPSQLLKDLLGTKRFPFVITTSFTPVVEQVMKDTWGSVKVLTFNNDPDAKNKSNKDGRNYGHDISSEDDLKRPTVFYMLGRYCEYPEYAVTDSDMMNYCASWIKGGGVPNILINELNAVDHKNNKNKKYLLFLGNNYSDWLYRFVWFALRTEHKVMKSDVIVNQNAEDTLVQFLERLETFYQDDPSEVIKNIKKEMDKRQNDILILPSIEECDVFISYSRSDKAVAENLYKALTDKGIRVWFDIKSIKTGRWKHAQNEGVQHSRLFVPILTNNVQKEVMKSHEYRSEWKLAAELSENMGGRTFIIPFAEQGFDFYNSLNKLPTEFHEMNAIWFSDKNDVNEIVNNIITELKKLKEIENKLKS